MRCIVQGKVVASKDPEFPEGAWGAGIATLNNHVVVSRQGGFSPIPTPKSRKDVEQTMSVASFVIGLTSYASVEKVLQPKEGDVVVVSGAAGAVGSLVGQLAKLRGARVIGIAGGEAKVKRVKEFFGFDDAIDYKNEDVGKRLAELAPVCGVGLFGLHFPHSTNRHHLFSSSPSRSTSALYLGPSHSHTVSHPGDRMASTATTTTSVAP
jgi:NADPH-dependent curcumin reductase CurA